MPARAHSSWVRGCRPCRALKPAPSPLGGEGWGEGAPISPAPFPLTRTASRSDLSPLGRGEERETARHGFGVFGKFRARCLPLTLPLSTGLIGRPSYSSTLPRSFTHATRVRFKPFSTSIAASLSV